MLSSDPEIEVVGAVPDPIVARDKIKQLNPDVLTLDIEMPRMDGISFLEKLMALRPMPVVMISSLTQEGAEATLRALELGAVDFIAKPADKLAIRLTGKAGRNCRKGEVRGPCACAQAGSATGGRSASKTASQLFLDRESDRDWRSTGGVEALNEVILHMPADSPAILVTQHMPEQFTASFARRLDDTCGDPGLGSPGRGAGVAGSCLYRPRETSIFASAAPAQTMFAP